MVSACWAPKNPLPRPAWQKDKVQVVKVQPNVFSTISRRRQKEELWIDKYDFLAGPPCPPPPPPKAPFQCPHPDKKGANLLLFLSIHLHTHQDLKLNCCRVTMQNLRYGRPCTHDLPGTHNWLAQPHIASISSESYYLMLAQSWKFGVSCCSSGLTHPAACTQARVPLTFGHVHTSPLSPSLLKKGANRLGLS